jgi:predicted transcriptional regulator
MNDNQFFKPTPLYKEFMILDLIEKDSKITQRVMSDCLNVSVSMINQYLDEYEEKGFVKRKYISTKTVQYYITKKGLERKKVLNIGFLNSSQKIYTSAKSNIQDFLNQIIEKGFKRILLYGAGEVAEIFLQVIIGDKNIPIKVVAVIDDDCSKQGQFLLSTPIMSLDLIKNINYDGILIASYTNKNQILINLLNHNHDRNKILNFFEI